MGEDNFMSFEDKFIMQCIPLYYKILRQLDEDDENLLHELIKVSKFIRYVFEKHIKMLVLCRDMIKIVARLGNIRTDKHLREVHGFMFCECCAGTSPKCNDCCPKCDVEEHIFKYTKWFIDEIYEAADINVYNVKIIKDDVEYYDRNLLRYLCVPLTDDELYEGVRELFV